MENDAIVWYTSKLYDRNHLACVMRNEYGTHDRSGCVRKPSGSIRCWCYGQSNCNNPENMIKLYEAFKMGDVDVLNEVIDDIETSDTGDYEEEKEIATATSSSANSGLHISHHVSNEVLEKTGKHSSLKSFITTSAATATATPAVPAPPPQLAYVPRSKGPSLRTERVQPHQQSASFEGDIALAPLSISSNSTNSNTTNRSFQKQRNHNYETIQQVKTIKVLPKMDEELAEENDLPTGQYIRVQNERKVRRKELGSGVMTVGTLLSYLISLLTFACSIL